MAGVPVRGSAVSSSASIPDIHGANFRPPTVAYPGGCGDRRRCSFRGALGWGSRPSSSRDGYGSPHYTPRCGPGLGLTGAASLRGRRQLLGGLLQVSIPGRLPGPYFRPPLGHSISTVWLLPRAAADLPAGFSKDHLDQVEKKKKKVSHELEVVLSLQCLKTFGLA
ncbi:M-phase-specific PLK1-interacting protein-like [Psammomys obesus]|uniref:M-phase-specific PLK1-interacting protein-like n=1 Tax=Psammomys obesus TaxID=48139 RepID=UPI002452E3D3|nr:M-phase-specific PLK1-interacting protein-like [Psammomys obesus]